MERLPTTRPLPSDPRTARLRAGERAGRGSDPLAPAIRGRVLGRYRLERQLGAGGFGVVWLGWDEKLEREVAVKAIPRGEHGSVSRRAEREARAAARLNHPGIVALYELAGDDGAVYLVSELVRGRTLAQLVRDGDVSDRDVARIGTALCDALQHAHRNGVVHRDVKPHNVLVVDDPAAGAGVAKLADFGVAHLSGADPLTGTGDLVGTLAYMAPEQADGRPVTPAADAYSLALTLYEGWTGSNPVRARTPAATARRLGRRPPALRSRRRDLPAELCRAIDSALDGDPARRPSVAELRDALERASGRLSGECGPVRPGVLERLVRTAGAVRALAPRAIWVAAALALGGWLASPAVGREGTALVVGAALAPTPLLLRDAAPLWSLPALAPLLGMAGLAPLFVALAGLVPGARRRAGLAAAGFVWLVAAELVTGKALLFGSPDGALAHPLWEDSLVAAARDALLPLLTSPALAPAAVWALLAAALPLAVSGRSLVLDVAGAALWAAAAVAAHRALADFLAASVELGQARGAVAGAALGALVAVCVALRASRRRVVGSTTVP